MEDNKFWLEEPKMMGWRGISLLTPALFSALGFCSFAVLGFGFTELSVLPQWFRTGLVLVGAFSLAIGGEIGTLSNTVEIFRKNGQATKWDWTALSVSVLATLAAFLLAFSALFGARANWSSWLQQYGPIVLGCLAALDSYGGFIEFGLYLNSFDMRYQEWQEAKRNASMSTGRQDALSERVESLGKEIELLQNERADLPWFRSVVSSANGTLSRYLEMDGVQAVKALCRDNGRLFDLSDKTAQNWRKEMEKVK